jgi:hypothetical protein
MEGEPGVINLLIVLISQQTVHIKILRVLHCLTSLIYRLPTLVDPQKVHASMCRYGVAR